MGSPDGGLAPSDRRSAYVPRTRRQILCRQLSGWRRGGCTHRVTDEEENLAEVLRLTRRTVDRGLHC